MIPSNSDELLIQRLLSLPAAERGAALELACAEDATLRSRVPGIEAKLAALEKDRRNGPSSMLALESMAQAFDFALKAAPAEVQGTRIGRYKLLQEIGRGGFGVVWMAEQEGPIRRKVALKIIKEGMDTKEVIARFEAERQALALMDHMNIARVFEAGATESGRPYFVMELVRGVAITSYCDENRLSVEMRLRLFMMVCQAVQHAHQKGVIHRDLKPTNILVTLHDGVAVPKVIDFGIAKATMSPLTDKTLFTRFHAFIGTPAYTSPEQMEMSGLDVDTRSDIYSLGVLLYELLAGRPPFDGRALVEAGLDAMRRMIRDVDPPKPSHRLTILTKEERISVAHQRNIEAGKLPSLLTGDLDWIVMRCLEKKRTRRYETADGLARDIQRHIQNEPVAARPPSTIYNIQKLIQRHRFAFFSVSSIGLVVVLGCVISTWEAVRASRAEKTAAIDRNRAEDLLTFMLGDLRTQLAKVGRLDVLESVGDKATAYFSSLDANNPTDTELARHAEALTQIGEIRMEQTRYAEAETAFSEAYRRAAALVARHPMNGDLIFERGQAEYWNGNVHYRRGEFPLAEEWMVRYRNSCAALVALDPSRSGWQSEFAFGLHNLAVLHGERGAIASARSDFVAELETLERMAGKDPNSGDLQERLADAHSWIGSLSERQGDFKEAVKQYEAQAFQERRLAEAEPNTVSTQYAESNALLYQADIYMATGQFAAANTSLALAKNLLDALVKHDPSNRHWLTASLNVRIKEAMLVRKRGDTSEAMRIVEQALPQLEKIAAAESAARGYSMRLATALRLKAQLQSISEIPAAAVTAKEAVAIGERLLHEGRATDADAGECATAYRVSGEIADKLGNAGESESDWLRASELLAARATGSSDWHLLEPSARVAAALGRTQESHAIIEKLNLLGYIPLDPWPDLGRENASKK